MGQSKLPSWHGVVIRRPSHSTSTASRAGERRWSHRPVTASLCNPHASVQGRLRATLILRFHGSMMAVSRPCHIQPPRGGQVITPQQQPVSGRLGAALARLLAARSRWRHRRRNEPIPLQSREGCRGGRRAHGVGAAAAERAAQAAPAPAASRAASGCEPGRSCVVMAEPPLLAGARGWLSQRRLGRCGGGGDSAL